MIGGMEVMQDTDQASGRLQMVDVLDVVAEVTGVSTGRLFGRCRKQRFSESRQMAWLVIRKWCGMTLTELGDAFGRDHSTILYGVETMKSKVRDIRALQWVLASIEKKLEEKVQ